MHVILIPLFLAANIGVRENDWKYGPEAIYDARVDSVSHPFGETEKIETFNMTMKLHCRPKAPLSLICQFNEPNLTTSRRKNSGNLETQEHSCGEEYFELKFDGGMIEEMVIPASVRPSKLDMMRALVAQLNVGVDFSTVKSQKFKTIENSTIGTCKTNYDISWRKRNENQEKSMKPYEIRRVPAGSIAGKGDFMEITRTRNLEDCHYRTNYFYGSREGQRATPSQYETKITASKSNMIFGKSNFTSWTDNTIVISARSSSIGYTLTERVALSLENIVAASGPLPTINGTSTASIFPGRWIHGESSEESNSSEEKSVAAETNDFI